MNKTIRAIMLAAAVMTTASAMADSDVTAERLAQNTPAGWKAVQLPNIPAITSNNTYDITSYGASTDSKDNTSAIQNALNAVPSTGGMVVIPAGTWLCGPITVKTKTVLHLAKGATLQMLPYGCGADGTTKPAAGYYPANNTAAKFNFNVLITIASSNVIIEGEGDESVIYGQGENWWDKRSVLGTRPSIMRFTGGTAYLVRNIKLKNSPGTNMTLGQSGKATHFTVHDVTISAPSSESSQLQAGEVVSHNTDGIPVWGAYANIYDCNISTGDDNIVVDSQAQYIHAWNINCGYGHGMSAGSYTSVMHDIIYEGITFTNTSSGFRIKTNTGRSGNSQKGSNGAVRNIICRNATMKGCVSPIKITSWYDADIENPAGNPTSDITETTPEFCDILFQNITESTGVSSGTSWKHSRPVYLYGRPELYIHDVTFDNVYLVSYMGMFMAYCKNITFKNGCKITNKKTSADLLSTEYLAYSDDGSTKISADPSKYNGSETAVTYTVNFVSDGTTYTTENICANSYAYPPTAPTKAGYTFKGWSTTEGGTAVSLAATELAAGGTYYALWESTTDIHNVESNAEDTQHYNIAGQQIATSAKGVHISNGRKILKK